MADPSAGQVLQGIPRVHIVEGGAADGDPAAAHLFVRVSCPYCTVDLTAACIGRVVASPLGPVSELWYPARCGTCGGLLLTYTPPSKVIRTGPQIR